MKREPDIYLRTESPQREDEALQKLPAAQISVALGLGIVGICIVAASMKTSDRATMAATAAAGAPNRFLAAELATLKAAAMRGDSRVAARAYFGIEECFRSTHPVPFDEGSFEVGRAVLTACAQNQIGALHAVGGPALASEGEVLLGNLGLLR
jgi:hypothetical protein